MPHDRGGGNRKRSLHDQPFHFMMRVDYAYFRVIPRKRE
jgi:hypothetical protein